MPEIKNLHAKIAGEETEILRGVDLSVPTGEVHAINDGPADIDRRRE